VCGFLCVCVKDHVQSWRRAQVTADIVVHWACAAGCACGFALRCVVSGCPSVWEPTVLFDYSGGVLVCCSAGCFAAAQSWRHCWLVVVASFLFLILSLFADLLPYCYHTRVSMDCCAARRDVRRCCTDIPKQPCLATTRKLLSLLFGLHDDTQPRGH